MSAIKLSWTEKPSLNERDTVHNMPCIKRNFTSHWYNSDQNINKNHYSKFKVEHKIGLFNVLYLMKSYPYQKFQMWLSPLLNSVSSRFENQTLDHEWKNGIAALLKSVYIEIIIFLTFIFCSELCFPNALNNFTASRI